VIQRIYEIRTGAFLFWKVQWIKCAGGGLDYQQHKQDDKKRKRKGLNYFCYYFAYQRQIFPLSMPVNSGLKVVSKSHLTL
jgi:hypothetical protein